MKVNTVDPATTYALELAAKRIKYQNKQMEIHRMEELLRQEKLRLERLKPLDPNKGQNIDIMV
jgi:hypothetical protein